MVSSMKGGLKSKEELVQKTRNGNASSTSTEAVVDQSTGTSYYSKTKEKNGNQKVKTFTKTESEEGPEYEMKKTYKPLFSSKYKEVDKPISANRGERKIEAMKKFMK